MCWNKINSKQLIFAYRNNFIHFKYASFKNHGYCDLNELPFSSESVIDILDEFLTDSVSENNNDTERDENHSNKQKDPSKYYSLSQLNTQSMTTSLMSSKLCWKNIQLMSSIYLRNDWKTINIFWVM